MVVEGIEVSSVEEPPKKKGRKDLASLKRRVTREGAPMGRTEASRGELGHDELVGDEAMPLSQALILMVGLMTWCYCHLRLKGQLRLQRSQCQGPMSQRRMRMRIICP